MKTHGICHAQSARKHRRAGHVVQENGDGRFKWWRYANAQLQAYAAGAVLVSMDGGGQPDMVGFRGISPTAIIVDEPLGDVHVSHIEWPIAGGVGHISVGDAYWPKRRNQHSKPYRVRSIIGPATIYFDRGEGTPTAQLPFAQFRDLIGKQIL